MIVPSTIFRREKKTFAFWPCFSLKIQNKIYSSSSSSFFEKQNFYYSTDVTRHEHNTKEPQLKNNNNNNRNQSDKDNLRHSGGRTKSERGKKHFHPFFTIIINAGHFQQPSPLAELLIIILNCGPRIRVSGHVQPRTFFFFFFFNGTFSS